MWLEQLKLCGVKIVPVVAPLLAAVTAISTARCTADSSGSPVFAQDAGPTTTSDQIYSEFTAGTPSGPPTASAALLIHKLGDMSMDNLFAFLAKVSDNQLVRVDGIDISGIHGLLYKYEEDFTKVQDKFTQVSDLWSYEDFNPNTVTPYDFKQSIEAVGTFTEQAGKATLSKCNAKKIKASAGAGDLDKNQAKSCVVSTPVTLNACTNDRDQAACNDLAAACICMIYFMFNADSTPNPALASANSGGSAGCSSSNNSNSNSGS